ncbi:MAG: bifunctional pyr operon transcriptional regulator/uracil phosphoribosyltransferase PyrR [Elusimicrobiota bacterium]|jgi:pyrimidine operon attenuation protein/uracil phosphoribosyltransferase|nr:bifunctional pyr operon transcriptional regulator/uracil phosphoribosyltransferase PyrR [Elusimicrobiota bacterium]
MEKIIQTAEAVDKTLQRIVYEIVEKHENLDNIAFIGIRTRGVFIAQRLKEKFDKASSKNAPLSELDITLYRDDLSQIAEAPVVKGTQIDFDISGKNIILVDDVLYTGRTIRAALTELADFGRPATIELAVLIDRGHREVPIHADYVGKDIPTSRREFVSVKMKDYDGQDGVFLGER